MCSKKNKKLFKDYNYNIINTNMSENQPEQPTIITLDKNSSIKILIQYIEISQKAGAYELKEAEILKRAADVLTNNAQDPEINENLAINLLIQGINKGQKHGGAYTLNDASLLHKVIQYIINLQGPSPSVPGLSENETTTSSLPQKNNSQPIVTSNNIENIETIEDEDDLASLSEPVPLRPKEI